MAYAYFIGIDISKDSFDVATLCEAAKPQHFANNAQGFAEFAAHFATQLPKALVVLEATGGYETALVEHLLQANIAVHRAATLQSSAFIRSLTPHRKTDASDAAALARYGRERSDQLALEKPATAQTKKLQALQARREDVLQMKIAEKQRLQHPRYALCRDRVQKMLECLTEELADIEQELNALIQDDAALSERRDIMQTVPGIGPQTSLTLLAAMPELGSLTKRQAASLAGVAPHPRESGKMQGYRSTRGGRRVVKKALYIAALSATRGTSNLAKFYQELIKNGKKPKVALIATARKIIIIINARLKPKNYIQPTTS